MQNLRFAMLYNSEQLAALLRNWASGRLDRIIDPGHAVIGVEGAVITNRGMSAQGLLARFTCAEVEAIILRMLEADLLRPMAIALICHYFLGWTVERMGRALDHRDVGQTHSLLLTSEAVFADYLLNNGKAKLAP